MKFSYSDSYEGILREDFLDEWMDEEDDEEHDEEMEEAVDEVYNAHAAVTGDMNRRLTELKFNCRNAIAEYIGELRYQGYKALTEGLAIRHNLTPLEGVDKDILSREYFDVAERAFNLIMKMCPLLSDEACRENVECRRKLSALSEIIDEDEENRKKGLMAV